MAKLRKNIWIIFILIVMLAFVLLSSVTVYLHNNTYDNTRHEQEVNIQLFSNSVLAFFHAQDSLLNVLGLQLIQDYPSLSTAIHDKSLDVVMDNYPALLGLGLVAYDGHPLVASSNFNLEQLPNLMELPQTRHSFEEARNTDRITTGPTYQINALQDRIYAMPIRRAIYDEENSHQAVAVMTAGIRIDNTPLFGIAKDLESYHKIQIIRKDGFRQFVSKSDINYSEKANDALIDKLNHLFSVERHKGISGSKYFRFTGNKNDCVTFARYEPYTEMFFVSTIPTSHIEQIFLNRFYMPLATFLLAVLAFFFLTRSIANSERRTREKLVYQAQHDPLTGLPSRQFLRDNIGQWAHSDNNEKANEFALIYIDIDNFKSVNDSYGHEYGDKVLVQAAQRLQRILSNKGLLVRESSDEFIYLTNDCDRDNLNLLAATISSNLSEPYKIENSNFRLGSCLGISLYPKHGQTVNELLGAADIALHEAKKHRNTTSFFTSEMQAEHNFNVQIEQKLRMALEKETPYVVFQPQVDGMGNINGVEALARWIDPEIGFISPEKFISIAETSGLIQKLGELIIEKSLSQIARLNAQLETPIKLSLNISVRQFTSETFASDLLASLDKHKIPPEIITLEITENLFIEDMAVVKPICTHLQKQGIRISLDDFGTGYSSLNMLNELAIDELKIDKSFVDKISQSERALSMITNIIAIGKNFGMSVLAEGVESAEQRDLLLHHNCDHFQGYFYARPLSFEDLSQYVKANRPMQNTSDKCEVINIEDRHP